MQGYQYYKLLINILKIKMAWNICSIMFFNRLGLELKYMNNFYGIELLKKP